MPDRQSVIDRLNGIHAVACGMGNDQCYLNGIGIKQLQTLINDATALLRAQEPSVMTLGDLRSIGSVWELNTPPYLWMEINPSYRWTRGFWVAWSEIYDMIDGLHPTYDADNYQKIWLCGTSRPTDEQKEATPWQGQSS